MPMESTRSSSPSAPLEDHMPESYEAAMDELELLVQRLESGEMPLDQVLSGYQRGAVLLQHCRGKLQGIEDQIKVLDGGALKAWKSQ